jgi:hypothetical protein
MRTFIQKNIVPMLVIATVALFGASYAIAHNVVYEEDQQPLSARIENSGWKKVDVSGVLTSQLDDSIVDVDLQGANVTNGGESTFVTSTISAIASSTSAIISNSLDLTYTDDTGILFMDGTTVSTNAFLTFDTPTATFSGDTVISDLYAGMLSLPQDGGLMDVMDIPVSSAAGDTVKQGYTFNIDGYAAFSIYAYDSANDGNASGTMFAIRGGKTEKARYVEAATSFIVGDYHINASTTAAAFTITLDSDFIAEGTATLNSVGVISDVGGSAGTNNITIATEGAETINGAATYVISGNYNSVHIKCNGTECFVF